MAVTKEQIRTLLDQAMATKQYWVIGRAVWTLWQYQTADEKAAEDTKHNNGVGFNGGDAKWLSIMGAWYQQGLDRHIGKDKIFSEKQANRCIKRLYKYCGQLAKIANQKAS